MVPITVFSATPKRSLASVPGETTRSGRRPTSSRRAPCSTAVSVRRSSARIAMIYLDHHATTPVCSAAQQAMARSMTTCCNPASAHTLGRQSAAELEGAREEVAAVLRALPSEITFVAGATEANNLVLRGILDALDREAHARGAPAPVPHIVTSAVEHNSILTTVRRLAARGRCAVTLVPVDALGTVSVADVLAAVRPDTALVSIMGANNEVGSVQPIRELGAALRARGVPFHADLAQSFGRTDVVAADCDAASMSAHKLGGPMGVGAVYLRGALGRWIEPQLTGGSQERGVRSGTVNVHGAVGFGAAAREMGARWPEESRRLASLRDQLMCGLLARLGGVVRVNGVVPTGAPSDALRRLPNNLHVTFRGVDPARLDELTRDRLAVSRSSACKALGGERSHVLEAMGVPDDGASIRFGLGACTTQGDIDGAVAILADAVRRAR